MATFSETFLWAQNVHHSKNDSTDSQIRNHGEEYDVMRGTPAWMRKKLEIIQKSVNYAEEKNQKTDTPAQYHEKLM